MTVSCYDDRRKICREREVVTVRIFHVDQLFPSAISLGLNFLLFTAWIKHRKAKKKGCDPRKTTWLMERNIELDELFTKEFFSLFRALESNFTNSGLGIRSVCVGGRSWIHWSKAALAPLKSDLKFSEFPHKAMLSFARADETRKLNKNQ